MVKKNKKIKKERIKWTKKQREYIKNSNKKINIFGGATGSGKTYLARYIIPRRLIEVSKMKKDPDAIVAIMGNTHGSAVRNIIDPMREYYGEELVGRVRHDNTCEMFGVTVHIFGGDTSRNKTKIQGANILYIYCDEIVTYNEEVLHQLMRRLRKSATKMDATLNPEGPKHPFKVWMDETNRKSKESGSPSQIYYLNTTIDDACLSTDPVENARLIQEQKDSTSGVHYLRNMLGIWAKADGLIYEKFAKFPEMADVTLADLPKMDKISIGVDFGGNKSKHAFVATGLHLKTKTLYVLKSESIDPKGLGPEDLSKKYVDFLLSVESKFGMPVGYTYADSAEQVLITGMRQELEKAGLKRVIWNALKSKVNDRIRATDLLLNTGKLKILKEDELTGDTGAKTVKEALLEALWDSKKDIQTRLDDGSTDIDTLDAFEYTFERDLYFLLDGVIKTEKG